VKTAYSGSVTNSSDIIVISLDSVTTKYYATRNFLTNLCKLHGTFVVYLENISLAYVDFHKVAGLLLLLLLSLNEL
jgi:hypothetical protein